MILWYIGLSYLFSPLIVWTMYRLLKVNDPQERKDMRAALYVLAPFMVFYIVISLPFGVPE